MKELLLIAAFWGVIVTSCINAECDMIFDEAELLLDNRPDSALTLLNTCYNDCDKLAPKSEARLSLLYSIALDKNYIDIKSDSIIAPAVRYYENHGDVSDRVKMHYYWGKISYNDGNYAKAVVLFEKADNLAAGMRDDFMRGLICRGIMMCHDKIFNYHEALKYAELADKYFQSAEKYVYSDYMQLSIGNLYYNLKRFDRANDSFRTAYCLGKENSDTNMIQQSLNGLALSLIEDSDKENDIQVLKICGYLQDSLKYSLNARLMASMAVCHAQLGNSSKAQSLIRKSIEIMSEAVEDSLYVGFSAYRINRTTGNEYVALDVLEQLFNQQDMSSRDALNQSVLSAQRDYFEQNAVYYQYRARVWRSIIQTTVFLLFLLIVLIVYVFHRKSKTREAVLERTITQLDELQRSYEDSLKQASEFSSKIHALYSMRYAYMNSICEEYYSHSGTSRNRHVMHMVDEMVNKLADESEYETLKDIVNHYCNGVMNKLEKVYPSMKSQDLRLMCYLYAGFSASAISLFLGISIDNVYTKKTRLKAKFSSLDHPYKEEFLSCFK